MHSKVFAKHYVSKIAPTGDAMFSQQPRPNISEVRAALRHWHKGVLLHMIAALDLELVFLRAKGDDIKTQGLVHCMHLILSILIRKHIYIELIHACQSGGDGS